jgi:hypothetical protein
MNALLIYGKKSLMMKVMIVKLMRMKTPFRKTLMKKFKQALKMKKKELLILP